jgi:hypothetical protein
VLGLEVSILGSPDSGNSALRTPMVYCTFVLIECVQSQRMDRFFIICLAK